MAQPAFESLERSKEAVRHSSLAFFQHSHIPPDRLSGWLGAYLTSYKSQLSTQLPNSLACLSAASAELDQAMLNPPSELESNLISIGETLDSLVEFQSALSTYVAQARRDTTEAVDEPQVRTAIERNKSAIVCAEIVLLRMYGCELDMREFLRARLSLIERVRDVVEHQLNKKDEAALERAYAFSPDERARDRPKTPLGLRWNLSQALLDSIVLLNAVGRTKAVAAAAAVELNSHPGSPGAESSNSHKDNSTTLTNSVSLISLKEAAKAAVDAAQHFVTFTETHAVSAWLANSFGHSPANIALNDYYKLTRASEEELSLVGAHSQINPERNEGPHATALALFLTALHAFVAELAVSIFTNVGHSADAHSAAALVLIHAEAVLMFTHHCNRGGRAEAMAMLSARLGVVLDGWKDVHEREPTHTLTDKDVDAIKRANTIVQEGVEAGTEDANEIAKLRWSLSSALLCVLPPKDDALMPRSLGVVTPRAGRRYFRADL